MDCLADCPIRHTGCPTKHDSWWIVLNVFFHNFLICLIPKRIIINIIWQSYYCKIDHRLRYIWVKNFSNELNCKKSLNLIQYLEDDILNYSSTVMFRGTPCSWKTGQMAYGANVLFFRYIMYIKYLAYTYISTQTYYYRN